MKIIHFSDTHLGFSDLDAIGKSGINLREEDFYRAFSDIIDAILEEKPDFVLHTGDLFHRPSPTNRAISVALEQFNRLRAADIPLILIAGNHETPKTKALAPILKIFENYENISVAYNQNAEIFRFDDIDFFALPHINSQEQTLKELERIEEALDLNKKRVLLMHCSVGAHYLMQEFGEWVYPKAKEYLFGMFDYVALGHWHGFGRVGKFQNVYYAGSSERTSSSDRRANKGYVVVKLGDNLEVKHCQITLRPFVEFVIDANTLEEELREIDTKRCQEAIVQVVIKNLDISKSIEIDNSYIESFFKNAASVKVKREFKESKHKSIEGVESLTLESFFYEHIKSQSASQEESKRLIERAKKLFFEIEESSSDTE